MLNLHLHRNAITNIFTRVQKRKEINNQQKSIPKIATDTTLVLLKISCRTSIHKPKFIITFHQLLLVAQTIRGLVRV